MIGALSRNRKTIILVVVLLLALVLAGLGCNSSKGRGVVEMMKTVPKEFGSFMYMDLEAFQNDTDLKDEYVKISENELVKNLMVHIGIELHDVDSLTLTGRDWGDFSVLFGGDFDLDEVREKLKELNAEEEDYEGIEIWRQGGEEGGVALVSKRLVIFGNVKGCINALIDTDASFYSDKNFRDVVERLPSGIIFEFQEGGLRIQQFYSSYDGLKASGNSMMKKDKDSMTVTSVCKFENIDAASKVLYSIQHDLTDYPYQDFNNIDAKQDAEFIIVTTDTDIEELLQ